MLAGLERILQVVEVPHQVEHAALVGAGEFAHLVQLPQLVGALLLIARPPLPVALGGLIVRVDPHAAMHPQLLERPLELLGVAGEVRGQFADRQLG